MNLSHYWSYQFYYINYVEAKPSGSSYVATKPMVVELNTKNTDGGNKILLKHTMYFFHSIYNVRILFH